MKTPLEKAVLFGGCFGAFTLCEVSLSTEHAAGAGAPTINHYDGPENFQDTGSSAADVAAVTPDPAQALAACNAAGGSTGCDAPATPIGGVPGAPFSGTVAGPSILAELLHGVTSVQSVACGASAHQPR